MYVCDGIKPSEALAQSRGGYRQQVNAIKKRHKQYGTSTDTGTGRTRIKRKKIQSHFKKVGQMRESPVAPRAVKLSTNKKKEDSDLEYADGSDTATRVDNNSTAIATIVDTIDGGQSNEAFTPKIETTECLLMNEDNISQTIAQKIMNSCPPPISKMKKPSTKQSSTRNMPVSTSNERNNSNNNITSQRGTKHPQLRKSIRSKLLEKVRDDCIQNHVVTRSSNFQELLMNLNLPAHWIRVIPSFRICEQMSDIESLSSKTSYTRLMSLG